MAGIEELLKLAEQFEAEILYDAHSLQAKIGRSESARKIVQLSGHEKDFLQSSTPTQTSPYPLLQEDLVTAWKVILA